MTADELKVRLMAIVDQAEADRLDSLVIFHAMALAFGEAMMRYMAPATALAFMEQETRKIAAQLSSQVSNRLQ